MRTTGDESSYSFQVDYRQNFQKNFAGSFAYINEGHVPGHHRDGDTVQLWARVPFWQDRIAISLGVGPYYFYDTQYSAATGTANVHGTAPIYSFSATGYLSNRWFYRMVVNRIEPTHELRTTTAAVGVGFWFGQDTKPEPGEMGDAPALTHFVTDNEVTVFGGQSVVNTFLSQKSLAYAVEYRRGLVNHLDWTLTGIYEGDPKIIRRNGLASQLWAVNTFYSGKVTVGIGAGPYIYLDKRHPSGGRVTDAAVAPLVSLTAARRFGENWLVRATFNRVVSSYNRDADVFLVGLGYRWE